MTAIEGMGFAVMILLLSFGAAILTIILITLDEKAEEFLTKIKNKIVYKKRKKAVDENKKIELFETTTLDLNLIEFEKWRVNDAILLLERKCENEEISEYWIMLMNKKIKEVKKVLIDYEKLDQVEQNCVEESIIFMLSGIANQIDAKISKVKKEKENKIKEVYERKIENIEKM